jgi:hypothetical protein
MTQLRKIRDRPLLTEIHTSGFRPESPSAYLFAISEEHRSKEFLAWRHDFQGVESVEIVDQKESDIVVNLRGEKETILLRSKEQLEVFCAKIGRDLMYLDITGLSHHVWAPLLRAALKICRVVRVVYVEPIEYRFSTAPTDSEIFDLSERINGLAPLPGFARLAGSDDGNACFIPLLGFEGTRLSYAIDQVQPPGKRIVPIVGVPGFQPEFPFHAYLGNKSALLETRAWPFVRFAIANCPFSLFYQLEEISAEYDDGLLQIAPIGTKPHALGAVMFTLSSNRSIELIYDHPKRKAQRTEGSARLLVYGVSSFLRDSN